MSLNKGKNVKYVIISALSLMSIHASKLPTNNLAQIAVQKPITYDIPGIKIDSTSNKYGSDVYLYKGEHH